MNIIHIRPGRENKIILKVEFTLKEAKDHNLYIGKEIDIEDLL